LLYKSRGELEKAEIALKRALRIFLAIFGRTHAKTQMCKWNYESLNE